jgi:hypothetical protein
MHIVIHDEYLFATPSRSFTAAECCVWSCQVECRGDGQGHRMSTSRHETSLVLSGAQALQPGFISYRVCIGEVSAGKQPCIFSVKSVMLDH